MRYRRVWPDCLPHFVSRLTTERQSTEASGSRENISLIWGESHITKSAPVDHNGAAEVVQQPFCDARVCILLVEVSLSNTRDLKWIPVLFNCVCGWVDEDL